MTTTTAPAARLWRITLLVLLGVLVVAILGMAALTASAERSAPPAATLAPAGATELVIQGGLKRPFPALVMRPDNPTTPQRVALGRLLYFDPVLSGGNEVACATCHHPDLGFTDGRAFAMGRDGVGVGPARDGGAATERGAPTVWNATYNHRQFWDGRAADLEAQALGPITAANEMNANPAQVEAKLRAIPEYAALFDEAFGGQGGSGVTFDNVTKALAAFERTLVSNNSAFDRYAAGDHTALTAEQKRGLNLFRSTRTRCFECHGFPTFANPDFKVIGVPETPGHPADIGRARIDGGPAYDHAFKIPTLRNIALTAPYMHNGAFATLEEVVDFYSHGGGKGVGMNLPNLDDKIRPFSLTAQEKSDLIAFLNALTDESHLPDIPSRVPSGQAVVPRLPRPPAVPVAAAAAVDTPTPQPPRRLRVAPGGDIQAVVDQAAPGDTIVIPPGTYHQAITVDMDDITLRGEAMDGLRPILDGEGQLADGILASGNQFTVEGLDIRNYTGNGVVVHGAMNATLRDLNVDNTGLYGVYPVEVDGVLVERVKVTGVRDAGIYVGQSRNIIVQDNEATRNVTGIEIENSVNAVVRNNFVHDNAGGILVFLLPNNPSKFGHHTRLVGNRVIANNHVNFADPAAIVSKVPSGTGILIMAADHTEVTGNEIRNNDSTGIGVISLDMVLPPSKTFDVDPTPENNTIYGNRMSANGRRPAPSVTEAGLPGADLLWDGSGWSNTWDQPGAKSFPPALPGPGWPDWARKTWWQVIDMAKSRL